MKQLFLPLVLASVGVNDQPILDPACNRDRGPIHVFTGRLHVTL